MKISNNLDNNDDGTERTLEKITVPEKTDKPKMGQISLRILSMAQGNNS